MRTKSILTGVAVLMVAATGVAAADKAGRFEALVKVGRRSVAIDMPLECGELLPL